MHLHSLLLLGAIAPLTLAAPSIKFCNIIGITDDCITEVMDSGVCKWIPDSNAKGDDGSQITIMGVRHHGDACCVLYEADDLSCEGPHSMVITDTWKMHTFEYTQFRSYKCWQK